MLRRITLYRYLAACAIIFAIGVALEWNANQSCAWDGCFPTTHPSLGDRILGPITPGILFGEIVVGLIIWSLIQIRNRSKREAV